MTLDLCLQQGTYGGMKVEQLPVDLVQKACEALQSYASGVLNQNSKVNASMLQNDPIIWLGGVQPKDSFYQLCYGQREKSQGIYEQGMVKLIVQERCRQKEEEKRRQEEWKREDQRRFEREMANHEDRMFYARLQREREWRQYHLAQREAYRQNVLDELREQNERLDDIYHQNMYRTEFHPIGAALVGGAAGAIIGTALAALL